MRAEQALGRFPGTTPGPGTGEAGNANPASHALQEE